MMVIPKALSNPNIILHSGFNPSFQTMAVVMSFKFFFNINFSKSNVEFAFGFVMISNGALFGVRCHLEAEAG